MKDVKRSLNIIAHEIIADWKNISPHAAPYIHAMLNMQYGLDGEKDVVLRFLCNAQTWRGEKAREIKKELNKIVA